MGRRDSRLHRTSDPTGPRETIAEGGMSLDRSGTTERERRAVFVANVRNPGHQVEALTIMGVPHRHFGVRHFTADDVARVERWPILRPAAEVLSQRVTLRGSRAHQAESIGIGQYLPPLGRKLGFGASGRLISLAAGMERRKVRSSDLELRPGTLLHFTEGMGDRELLSVTPRSFITVLEKRSMHPGVFTDDLEVWAGFPGSGGYVETLSSQMNLEQNMSDHIIVYSDFARDSYLSRGWHPGSVHVVPLPFESRYDVGLNVSRMPELPVFTFIGRCDANKGIDVAVAATQRIEGAGLVVYGEASRSVREWLGRFSHVDYRGVKTRSEILAQARNSHGLLMPSRESFGLAVLEVAAVGIPVFVRETTGVGGVLEAEVPGTVIAGRDPGRWADSLVRFLGGGEREWRRRGAALRDALRRFSWERSVEIQMRVYNEIWCQARV